MQRPAFTLPEVLAAVLIFAIGILGLASSGTFIAIQAGEARALTEGAVLAGRVLDSLRSVPCSTRSSGQETYRSAMIRWSASAAVRSTAIDLTLELPGRQGSPRQWRVTTLLPC